MRKTIVLTFTAAVLLMAAASTLELHGRNVYEYHMAAVGSPSFTWHEYHHPLLESWDRVSDVVWLLSLGVLVAGLMLSAAEPTPPHHVSMLGLDAGARRRSVRAPSTAKSPVLSNVRAAAQCLPRDHDDESVTPLERVIRGY